MPEPVARSVVGNLLEFMPRKRLAELHARLGLVTAGTYASVLVPILAVGVWLAIGVAMAGGSNMSQGLLSILGIAVWGLNLTGLIMLLMAWFRLARTDGDMGETQLDRAAKRAGLFMLISYVAWLLAQILGGGSSTILGMGGAVPTSGTGVLGTIGTLCLPIWIGFSAAYLWNAQRFLTILAGRVPDPLLEHRSRGRQLSSVLWWTLGLLALLLGPLVAISNLLSTIKDVRFHTKRLSREPAGGAGAG